MKWTFQKLLCAAVLSVIIAGFSPAAVDDIATLVPPDTFLFIEVEDFAILKKQFEKTEFYKLYNDPRMAEFISHVKSKLSESLSDADDEVTRAFFEGRLTPKGKIGLALLNPTKDTFSGVFISQWGENIGQIKEVVREQRRKDIAEGDKYKTTTYQGVEINTIIENEDSAEESSKPSESVNDSYCFINDLFLGADKVETLEFVIAQLRGAGSETLADLDDYGSTIKQVGPYHDVKLYLNIRKIKEAAVSEDPNVDSVIKNLGVTNVSSLAVSAGIARRLNSDINVKALLRVEGTKKGLCKMLDPKPALLDVPDFVPKSAFSLTVINLDIQKSFEELGNILTKFSPEAASFLYAPLLPPDASGGGGISLKNGIIDHLGNRILITQIFDESAMSDEPKVSGLNAIAVSNATMLERTISELHAKILGGNNPDLKKQLLGYNIYLISPMALPMFQMGQPQQMQQPGPGPGPGTMPQAEMPMFAVTITDTHLIFGLQSSVEKAIRTMTSGGETLASADWFKSIKSQMPSVVGFAGLQQNAVINKLIWKGLKKSKGGNINLLPGLPQQSPLEGENDASAKQLDFTLLPEFDEIEKYFGPSYIYGVGKTRGFYFELNQLKPQE